MIIRYAIGVDNIDLAAASERGIPVVNVPDYGIDEVSTYAVTLLLCAARKIPQTIDMIRRAEWNYAITKPMYRTAGKTVGLIGFGRIPRAVAKSSPALTCRFWLTIRSSPRKVRRSSA